ncbi:MAG TPA: oligosaccharide flippase family protein [Polyangiales bacterium]
MSAAGTGRGLALITLAKLYFILTGFVVQVGLPRLLGSPTAFGRYSLVMSMASVINNVLIAATVQSVSKRVSEDEELAAARLRQGLAIQLVVGVLLAGGLTLLAPVMAGFAYDEDLTLLLRIVSIVPLCYALYAALVGSLNGRRMFMHQAGLDMTFSTVRTIGIVGAAALGYGAAGAVAGFAGGALIILLVALFVVGTGKEGPKLPIRSWVSFLVPIVIFQLMLNGTLLLDVWVFNNTIAQLGIESGLTVAQAAERATSLVGLYKAGQNFAFVPYQIILAVTFVVFPLVSRATASGDLAAARTHIDSALRFSAIALFGMAAPISGGAEGLMRLAYGTSFLGGAETLRVLVFGEVGLALFVIIATILSGAGKPAASALSGLIALLVVLFGNRLLVRAVGLGDGVLATAALATSLGPLAALVVSSFAMRIVLGVLPPLVSFARCAVASVAGYHVARAVPQGSALMAPVAMVAGGLAYLLALVLLRELGRGDLSLLTSALRKRSPSVAT